MIFLDSSVALPFLSLILLYAGLGLGNVLDFFRFRLLYLQLLSSLGMLVFL